MVDGLFASYGDYAKQLRAWLVTFGLGGPVLFFTKPELFEKLSANTRVAVVWAFLGGCGLQIFLAVLNKYINWVNYNYCQKLLKNPAYKQSKFERATDWTSDQIWIDFVIEVLTIVAFVYAVYQVTSAGLALVESPVINSPPPD